MYWQCIEEAIQKTNVSADSLEPLEVYNPVKSLRSKSRNLLTTTFCLIFVIVLACQQAFCSQAIIVYCKVPLDLWILAEGTI